MILKQKFTLINGKSKAEVETYIEYLELFITT